MKVIIKIVPLGIHQQLDPADYHESPKLSPGACRREIRRRGGEIDIVGRYGTEVVDEISRKWDLVLMRAEGWRQYSRAFGARRAQLAYLCGHDDSGVWAVRVAGTCLSVRDALEWLMPRPVRQALDRGLVVSRQGDIYIIRLSRGQADRTARSARTLPLGHSWDTSTRTLHHAEHASISVPYAARFVPQRAYRMGRSGRKGAAD
jgi:hypothetical protein